MSSLFKRVKRKSIKPKKLMATIEESIEESMEGESDDVIYHSQEENIKKIKETTGNSTDVVIRYLKIGKDEKVDAAIVYIAGIVDSQSINEFILETLMHSGETTIDMLEEKVVSIGKVNRIHEWKNLFLSLMAGETILLVNEQNECLTIETKGGEKRQIQEPSTQMSIRGPRDSFTETLGINIALVRRIIKNPNLWIESMKIGRQTKTDVAFMYIEGIANDKVVKEVRKRLKKIDIDSILESGYVEQLIEDETMTTFPTIYHTERPDMVAGNLLEGRIAIFVDGTPFVLLAPALFIQFFQAADDYYARFDIATAIRFLRVLTFFISLVAPAVYIAATTFHQEMIPTQLLVAIAAQREAVPFPAFVEALIMEIAFEILREAGIRMPKAIGSAISIVGALVIGQAAVQAGIVSPAMVIIVAITAIASFSTPSFAIAVSARLIRFLFMILAATFGFYGLILGIIMMIVHLCDLRSFGVPYMTPLAPFIPENVGDTVVRLPWWALRKRPKLIGSGNITRESAERPTPPREKRMVKRSNSKGDTNET
jgi:spore germination protein KA